MKNYFYNESNLEKITEYMDPFLFLSYPYEADSEIHGFPIKEMNKYSSDQVKYVCRGGLFGGHKDFLSQANGDYYDLVQRSLSEGLAGTEESVFTIMSYLYPESYRRFKLDENGLIVKFMQAIDEDNVQLSKVKTKGLKFKTYH